MNDSEVKGHYINLAKVVPTAGNVKLKAADEFRYWLLENYYEAPSKKEVEENVLGKEIEENVSGIDVVFEDMLDALQYPAKKTDTEISTLIVSAAEILAERKKLKSL